MLGIRKYKKEPLRAENLIIKMKIQSIDSRLDDTEECISTPEDKIVD